MSIKHLLVDEFNSQLAEVHKMKVGSDEYKTSVDGVTKIADRIIEIEKFEQEASFKNITHENECEIKAAQLSNEKRDRIIRNAIEVGKIAGGIGLAVWGYMISMKYEDKGLIPTTEGGRTALKGLFKFMK